MTRVRIVLIAMALAAAACEPGPVPATGSRVRLGYTEESSTRQASVEQLFQSGVTAQSISDLHRPLTERPHPAGSEATAALVKHLQSTLSGFGLDVSVHEYQALLSHPRSVSITLTAPTRREIRIAEPVIAEDPTSQHPELGGGWIAYSASGTASGQVVFVDTDCPPTTRSFEVKAFR